MNKEQNKKEASTGKIDSENYGRLLDKFKIKVKDNEFIIELYHPVSTVEGQNKYSVLVNGEQYSVEVLPVDSATDQGLESRSVVGTTPKKREKIADSTKAKTASVKAAPLAQPVMGRAKDNAKLQVAPHEAKTLSAPMPGKILEIKVNIGDDVEAGQPLVILEAMKMENVMTAPASGRVVEIPIKVGVNVNQGDILVHIE